MSIFSNLEGTLNSKFTIGKNGSTLVFENNQLKIMDYTSTNLLPLQAGDPVQATDVLTLQYYANNPSILNGTTVPDNSLGLDNNVYFLMNSNSIESMYFKKSGAWIKSDYISSDILASIAGSSMVGLSAGGTLQNSLYYITPEQFGAKGDGTTDDTTSIQACSTYAGTNNIPVIASGTYLISSTITMSNVQWSGGTFLCTGNTQISVSAVIFKNITFNKVFVKMTGAGGDSKFYFNKWMNQTATAAFLIQTLTTNATVDLCFNEFTNCNYAVLQQGSGAVTTWSRYSYNHFHEIKGDAIELNVVNGHYANGLTISHNNIENIDATGPNWGIGIGVAGSGPYGVTAADSQYAQNFIISNNRVYNVRQCIHVEVGKNFEIKNNETFPSDLVSVNAGLATAGVAIYGSQNFIIDGLYGRNLSTPDRIVFITWGVNSGIYAGPPINFSVKNIDCVNDYCAIYTGCSNDFTNETQVKNVAVAKFTFMGLPSSSIFNNIKSPIFTVIGQHLSTDGFGGGIYTRTKYTYTNWSNCVCISDYITNNVSITKMYVDRIDQNNNNFFVSTDIDGAGHRGPVVTPITEQYLLSSDVFPGGRYFNRGTVLYKPTTGKYIVTTAGAYIDSRDYIQATTIGQTYIQSANLNWASDAYGKQASTSITIPGAGASGADLVTYIVRSTYVLNNYYTIDIADPIQTATASGLTIKATTPVAYSTIDLGYSKAINKSNWTLSGSVYQLTIPQTTHLQSSTPVVTIYQNVTDAATSTAPFQQNTSCTIQIDSSNNITITSTTQFSGEIVINGR